MKRERSWEIISRIANSQQSCINPRGINHDKAKRDFEKYDGRIRYYSFPLDNNSRGYARFIYSPEANGLFLDYVTPWNNPGTVTAFKYLAAKMTHTTNIFIISPNCQKEIKPYTKEEGLLRRFDPGRLLKGISQRVYLSANPLLSISKIEMTLEPVWQNCDEYLLSTNLV